MMEERQRRIIKKSEQTTKADAEIKTKSKDKEQLLIEK